MSEKDIKSHFKKLSKLYHPDKVRATAEQTIEDIQNKFVDITKAYKSLTDETIRRNWEEWGDPDGRQQMSMGIALPIWIIEGKNNIWVLGVYGLLFGGGLPMLVGRWWFGSRQRTKDGISAHSAAAFFKSMTESSEIVDAMGILAKAYKFECTPANKDAAELARLQKEIATLPEAKWAETVMELAGDDDEGKRRALTLLLVHLLRFKVESPALKKEQRRVLLHTPTLLNALLTIATSRKWFVPTMSVMRLHAYIIQALLPTQSPLAQLPDVKPAEVPRVGDVSQIISKLTEESDVRAADIRKAAEKWGNVDIYDASFRVIDEKQVTPSAIVFLVVKLRLVSPLSDAVAVKVEELDPLDVKANDRKDYQFLNSRKDTEEDFSDVTPSYVHAPYWPSNRKPSWWIVLADPKSSRLAIPPMKISDVPSISDLPSSRPYRSYKIQFQAPPTLGTNNWRVYVVSDSFIGAESWLPITLKVEEPVARDEAEDDISDPEEDTLAGQMAMMKGGKVKRTLGEEEEESDDESGTDDDQNDDDSSSDSD
ncbi:Sec63 Brl domain-containing protein [Mucidula mucida]|nr:Sec63 Brl domain-containing protein [Mucidula mucida]